MQGATAEIPPVRVQKEKTAAQTVANVAFACMASRQQISPVPAHLFPSPPVFNPLSTPWPHPSFGQFR